MVNEGPCSERSRETEAELDGKLDGMYIGGKGR